MEWCYLTTVVCRATEAKPVTSSEIVHHVSMAPLKMLVDVGLARPDGGTTTAGVMLVSSNTMHRMDCCMHSPTSFIFTFNIHLPLKGYNIMNFGSALSINNCIQQIHFSQTGGIYYGVRSLTLRAQS
jgi:hypothetical protein